MRLAKLKLAGFKTFVDPTTILMPGHGVSSTIGAERPHLQEWVDRGW